MQYHNIQIYFCNIHIKHWQHCCRTFETSKTYACNMQQTLLKIEEDGVPRSSLQGSSRGLVRRRPGASPWVCAADRASWNSAAGWVSSLPAPMASRASSPARAPCSSAPARRRRHACGAGGRCLRPVAGGQWQRQLERARGTAMRESDRVLLA